MIERVINGCWRHAPAPLARTACLLLDRLGWQYAVPGELSSCPACGAPGTEALHPLPLHGRQDHYRVGFASGCRRCGIVFANPMPSKETLARMYTPAGVWGRTHEHDRHEHSSSRHIIRLLEPVRSELDIAHPPPGSAVLDFGCGSGELLDLLQDHGWTTYGIEPAVKSAFARHRELQQIPSSPMFRLAVAHHVLEHVSDPLAILRALFDALEPGSFLFVSVPRLDMLAHHRDFRYCINDRAHVVSYTRDAMASLMALAGFSAIDLNPPGDVEHNRRALKRLRMLGRKGGPATVPEDPLRAARQAFAAWAASGGGAPPASVRAAAAMMNAARARSGRRRPGRTAAPGI